MTLQPLSNRATLFTIENHILSYILIKLYTCICTSGFIINNLYM